MLAVDNPTPLPAFLLPGLDQEGRTVVTVVVKATFLLREGDPALAEEQAPMRLTDEHTGEPGASSVRYESDLGPQKVGTDVILVGQAWSPTPVPELEVSLAAGRLRKVVRVFGDRAFFRAGGEFGVSAPRPFTRMPLTWERAYGGADGATFEARNPVGVGFVESAEGAEDVRLPNLEDPRALIAHPHDRPAPAGFGVVARHWAPRRGYAGTMDEAWKEARFPLLPLDFDRRHHQSATADLISPKPFSGGEPVRVEGASERGALAFRVPSPRLQIGVSIKRSRAFHQPTLDTLLIEPDARRLTCTYRLTFPCPKSYLSVDGVTLDLLKGAA